MSCDARYLAYLVSKTGVEDIQNETYAEIMKNLVRYEILDYEPSEFANIIRKIDEYFRGVSDSLEEELKDIFVRYAREYLSSEFTKLQMQVPKITVCDVVVFVIKTWYLEKLTGQDFNLRERIEILFSLDKFDSDRETALDFVSGMSVLIDYLKSKFKEDVEDQ